MEEKQATIKLEAKGADITVWGLFMYGDYPAGKESAIAFWSDFNQNQANFDLCTGIYRMEISCCDGRRIYFCDNSGCARYYIHEKSAAFHTTLMAVLPREKRAPNYGAVAQFLFFGCIYGMDTPVEGVIRSDPTKYYIVEQGNLTTADKNLTPLEEMLVSEDALDVQIRRFASSASQFEKLACTITGGTDSRAILAHLLHKGLRPNLNITGHDGQADVEIARQIAEMTGLDLMVVSDVPEDDHWIDEAIAAADGMSGVCGIYRLYRKARLLRENGFTVEFGGAAGEAYKNSFINQDLPFYGGKPRWKRFVQYKVATYDFPQALCGEKIAEEMHQIPDATLQRVSRHTGKNKANAYLNAGYEIMQDRTSGVYGMSSRWYVQYNPLMERNVAALAFRKNPYKLEMQAYQREQVTRFWPQIKSVETDRGLTCDSARKGQEFMKSNLFLVRVAMERVFGRKKAASRIDPCFAQGLNSEQFHEALARCKELGIIPKDISKEQIPQGIADRLFALGTLL